MEPIDAATAWHQFKTVQAAFQVIATINLTGYMFQDEVTVHDGQNFDYIIVGAGTAGSIVATRLAEMDPKNEVLLIEAGGDPPFETTLPKLMLYPLYSKVDWNFTTKPDGFTQLGSRGNVLPLHLGKLLGGTSCLNYLIYSVGNKNDYNLWASYVDDHSWSWDGVFPYFKKSQKLEDCVINKSKDKLAFGHHGPVIITKETKPTTRKLVEAFGQLGYATPPAITGDRTLGYAPLLISLGDGKRQTIANSYLARFQFPNLKILKNALVTKIIIDKNKIATGVKVLIKDKSFVTLHAKREIVISAGVINSPKILMHSGIGPKNHLDELGIPVLVDLPVGQNLVDNIAVSVLIDYPKMTEDPLASNPASYPKPALSGYVTLDKCSETPEYSTLNFLDFPSNHMFYCVVAFGYKHEICNNLVYRENKNLMLWTLLVNLRTLSRGSVTLSSKHYYDPPIINPMYYSNRTDLYNHAKYVRDFLRTQNSNFFQSNGASFVDPKLEACNCLKFDTQEYWECYVRHMMGTLGYLSGTCSMGPVVDSKLRVLGVQNLRVADASVIPVTISGDLEAAVVMAGEKAADIIMEEHRKC